MMYCGNCGLQMDDNDKYCRKCGAKMDVNLEVFEYDENHNSVFEGSEISTRANRKSPRVSILKIIAWFFLFPFMIIYTIMKTKKINNKLKAVLIILLFVIVYLNGVTDIGDDTENNTENDPEHTLSEVVSEAERASNKEVLEDKPDESIAVVSDVKKEVLLKGVDDYDVGQNIIHSSNLINLKIHEAKNIEKESPWVGGDRYSMSYEGNKVIVYINGDDTVNSINIGDIKVYEQGYEPLNIDDYLTTTEMDVKVSAIAKDLVKSKLNYPETAKFPWLDWGYARANDIYAVQSNVTAKNAFGVESKMPFYIEFKIEEKSIKTVYFLLDGKVVVGSETQLKATEKVLLKSELVKKEIDKGFVIEYGVLGDYGKEEAINGNKEIYYYVPAGEYKVSTINNSAALIVLKKEPYKNSDGYMEHETVSMNRFNAGTSSRDVTVGENEKILVTVQARFEFLPLEQ